MPIYEYECPQCGRMEVLEKISDNPDGNPRKCQTPGCKHKMKRLILAASFHLKGSGWYKTDYSSSGSSASSSSKNGSSSESGTDSSAASDKAEKSDKSEKKSKGSLKTSGGCGSGCSCH